MRSLYAFGVATLLLASPALADVVIGTGSNDSARHEYRADQDRAAARHDMGEARRDAAMGNYAGAAQEQREAHHEWRDANHQERKADRDDRGGVGLQFGH